MQESKKKANQNNQSTNSAAQSSNSLNKSSNSKNQTYSTKRFDNSKIGEYTSLQQEGIKGSGKKIGKDKTGAKYREDGFYDSVPGINTPGIELPAFNPPVPNRAWTEMRNGIDIEELDE